MEIRKATIDDLALVSAVEAECFPPAEAATRDSFKERLTYYGNHFWLLFERKIDFLCGRYGDKPCGSYR